jgi:hypothetical protein
MAARDMMHFAGDIGTLTFYQGLFLVMTAVVCGILQLMRLCTFTGSGSAPQGEDNEK